MDLFGSIFSEELGWVFTLLVFLCFIFICLTIMLLMFILYLRVYKNRHSEKKQQQEDLLVGFINSYLFDDDFDKDKEISDFKEQHVRTSLQKKLAIKQILIYNDNFKGESSVAIRQLFSGLELYALVTKDLEKGRWFKKARSIYVMSQLGVPISGVKMNKLLNSSRPEVREQALLHYIKLSKDKPLEFLDKIEFPLTLWLQIFIENALKYTYQGPIPDFSQWLGHPLSSVTEFCIKQIAEYNQYENIPLLLPFLDHPVESIRKQTIRTLVKLEYEEAIDLLVPAFAMQSRVIKKEILKMFYQFGAVDKLHLLEPQIPESEPDVKIDYLTVKKALA